MAFPGGREEPEDCDLHHTAVRETKEEVFIDLRNARLVGRLQDMSYPSLMVSAFVFLVQEDVITRGNEREVEQIFWLPLWEFNNEQRLGTKRVEYSGRWREFPVITISGADVWGISLGFVRDLLSRLEEKC